MSPASLVVLSLSMSADAFAAAIGRGAATRPNLPAALRGGLLFGVIEAITPLVGYAFGLVAAGIVERVDHWIAFILLALVGGRMAFNGAFGEKEMPADEKRKAGVIALAATAVGTSIDAAAVGVGLAFVGVNIWLVAAAIGVATFVMATTGLLIGRAVGLKVGSAAEVIGGVALICIGAGILIEHTGVLA